MNILTLSHAYVEPANRRVWERLVELYRDVRVTVVTPAQWQTNRYGPVVTYSIQPERRERYEIRPLPLANSHFRHYAGLGAVLRACEPDIVCIAQERYDWSTLFALLAVLRLAPRAQRLTFTLTNIDYHLSRPQHILKERLFFALSDAILASDSESERLLHAHGYRGRTSVQYTLGAVEPPVEVSTRAESPLVVGYLGTLATEKGVADLLAAVAQLHGSWRLCLMGDGPQRQALEAQASALGIAGQVVFQGYVARDTVMEQLANLHVLVLPSHTTPTWKEQFGVVLVEAMAAGAVVVGSNSGAIPEVIGDAGLLFPEEDVPALAANLQRLHDDPAFRADLAARGRQRALEHYSATALARQFYAFACSLLGETPCAS